MAAVAVLTSGGDAPGMNAAIRAVSKVAASRGVPVWGVEIIIKAEGVPLPTHELMEEVTNRLGGNHLEIRGTVLGHLVRGGNPIFRDRQLAGRFGLVAVDAIFAGVTDRMAGWNLTERGDRTSDSWIRLFPIADVLEETQSLLDGTSEVSLDRVRRMEAIQGVLAL